MKTYRIAVDAQVRFNVTADTPEQAREQAAAKLLSWVDGIAVDTGDDTDDLDVYPDECGPAEITYEVGS